MENESGKKVVIAAVGDIHVKESDRGKWMDCFKTVSHQAQILLIPGDLTDTGSATEAAVLAEELKSCTIPVVMVLGNHDYDRNQQEEIKRVLVSDNVHVLDGECITIDEIGIAGIKGFGGGFDRYTMPMFGEEMNKHFVQEAVNEALKLDQALVRLGGENVKKIAIMHYSPIKATVEGENPEIYAFLGSSRLAEPLNSRQVIAAFHGHAHVGALHGETTAGVKVFNVAKHVLKKSGIETPFFLFEIP